MNDILLEDVSVAVEAPEGFDILVSIPSPKLEYSVPGTCYVALSLPESILSSTGKLSFARLLLCLFVTYLFQQGHAVPL